LAGFGGSQTSEHAVTMRALPGKRWIEPSYDLPGDGLAEYSPVERAILAGRGVRTDQQAEQFLSKRYAGATEPFLLTDMQAAIERLQAARHLGHKVVVYGDYDADGVTATVLLYEVLQSQGFNVGWYIPDRFEEGYGLNADAMARLRADGANLVVSVDSGIRSVEVVELANSIGLDVIVTDHHLPGDILPPALAVLNPNRQGDNYPFKGLSGVGVAFKLAQGLLGSGGVESQTLLDLVAVGTVADLAPLTEENRQLVSAGLERLNSEPRPGLRALAEHAGVMAGRMTANSIGFGLAPRLNAAGRLAKAGEAVVLLLAKSAPEAWARAGALDQLNRERQQLTNDMLERAREIATSGQMVENLIVAIDPTFHEGVVGLIAARLVDEFYRPALVAREEGESIRGSARSIPEFHITRALEECSELLDRFGGHAGAAGFGLESANWEAFLKRLDGIAGEALREKDLRPSLSIDAVVDFELLTDGMMDFIDRLEPCGQANPQPVFATRHVSVLSKRTVGGGRRHLKLAVRQADRIFEVIGFNMGDQVEAMPATVDLAYRLERNEFRGVVTLELVLQDFRPG